jgi:4-hydroxy-2-oxoglutarate aldolase
MNYENLKGVFAPITTPFATDDSESVDIGALRANMEYYAGTALSGYLALGSNGENKSLTRDEQDTVLKTAVERRAPGQVIMAGCIAESTRETVYLAQRAESLGADYITLLSPCYFKKQMTDARILSYFTGVADKVNVPCLLYNAPGFTGGLTLTAKVIEEASRHPNIGGVKDTSAGNISVFTDVAADPFAVMSGTLNNFLEGLVCGAIGGVISLANCVPELVTELYDLYTAGKYEACFALNKRLQRLNRAVSGKGGVASVKAAMDLVGLAGGAPRRPMIPLPDREKDDIRVALEREGALPS